MERELQQQRIRAVQVKRTHTVLVAPFLRLSYSPEAHTWLVFTGLFHGNIQEPPVEHTRAATSMPLSPPGNLNHTGQTG